MSGRFEQAFIQCLKDGVYPGPSNINERYRKDGLRFNRLNGEQTKERLYLMYMFGIPYMRGPRYSYVTYGGVETIVNDKGSVPEYPYLTQEDGFAVDEHKPEMGSRKHEIQPEDQPWKLRLK